jgi:hypothetical protein
MDQQQTIKIVQDVINGFSLTFTTKLYEQACKMMDQAGILIFVCDKPADPRERRKSNFPLKPLARGVMSHLSEQTKCFEYSNERMSFNEWVEMVNTTRDFLNILK